MSFETGKMGRQAGGSVVSRTQDTIVRFDLFITPFFLSILYIGRAECRQILLNSYYEYDERNDETVTI